MNRRRIYGRALADADSRSKPADAAAKRCNLSRAQESALRACVERAVVWRDLWEGTRDNLHARGLVYIVDPEAPFARRYVRATPLGESVIRQLDTLRAAIATGQ